VSGGSGSEIAERPRLSVKVPTPTIANDRRMRVGLFMGLPLSGIEPKLEVALNVP
jgi:hypothetical protein